MTAPTITDHEFIKHSLSTIKNASSRMSIDAIQRTQFSPSSVTILDFGNRQRTLADLMQATSPPSRKLAP